jgi:hypothetical protein
LKAAGVLGAAGVVLGPTEVFAEENHHMRWDLLDLDFSTGQACAGGRAWATAEDDSTITLTGTGTFRSNPGRPQDVTGGGTWTASGSKTGSGTYEVVGFVSYVLAPGVFPPITDCIGDKQDVRAGLAHFRIAYNDGDTGVLVVSCHLVGTPNSVFEGITVSKSFVDYSHHGQAVAGVNANRTNFHVIG